MGKNRKLLILFKVLYNLFTKKQINAVISTRKNLNEPIKLNDLIINDNSLNKELFSY